MHEPSRPAATNFIAELQHRNSARTPGSLQPGKKPGLSPESYHLDDPYDPEAVASYHEETKTKLGYVPTTGNAFVSAMGFYGQADAFEACVLQVDEQADPWHQARVGVYARKAR